jgi:hypothetical protein
VTPSITFEAVEAGALEAERQHFIDQAAIHYALPGVPPAKAFRLADELWTAREAYLRERASKT